MERHLIGFMIFLATFSLGVCTVDPRLVFEEEEEFHCFARVESAGLKVRSADEAPKVRT